jgi:alkylated DNA repair dioxygenase AlkB
MEEIKGLRYVSEFISLEEEQTLITTIDELVWLDDLKRRVQHYGYKYDYKKRKIDNSMRLGPLPSWADALIKKITLEEISNVDFDQLIVNEYACGQGITPHIDCEPCFEETIISLSVGNATLMDFQNKNNRELKISQLLQPRSILIIESEARYDWLHGIKGRKKDPITKEIFERRISLTFRKVKI